MHVFWKSKFDQQSAKILKGHQGVPPTEITTHYFNQAENIIIKSKIKRKSTMFKGG